MNINIVEFFKDIAAVVGGITALFTLCNFLSKSCRDFFKKAIRHFAGSDENEEKLNTILTKISEMKIIEEGLVVGLRYRLRDIYYAYVTTGELTLKEKETFIDIYSAYKKLHGNHQADVWYEELVRCKVIDPYDEEVNVK